MTLFARIFLIFSFFSCFLVGGAALAKEWDVGFRNILVSDPVIHHDIEVAVWYPTQAKAKKETIGSATLHIARGAELHVSSRGLIIISHGFSGNSLGHNDTAQFLASLGYVVATPTHPDLQGLKSGKPGFDPLVARPRHIQLIIDELLNHPPFKTNLHQNRIGIIGFSLGTYTALTVAGAKPGLSGLATYCTTNIKDALLCSTQASQRFTAIAPNLISQRDNRIGGAVLLAPAYGPLFSKNSLANVKIPVRLFSAEKDQELNNRYNAQHFEEFLPNTASIEVIKDAGHFVFMAPCPEGLKRAVPFICEDAESVDRVAVHQKLNRDIAKFFNEVLK